MRNLKFFFFALILSVGCSSLYPSDPVTEGQLPWTHAFDLDGDGQKDRIEVEFTGGAHCCYRITVHLTSNSAIYRLPFQLDGGYVGGLDLSRPDQFDIRKTGGALPELVMEIGTYNGEPMPLPERWKQQYGIRTHFIAIGFAGGRLHVRDLPRGR